MARALTGVSASLGPVGLGVQWDNKPGDHEAALKVLTFLEDRRLLFGVRHAEDEYECVQSAQQIRRFLTDVLGQGTTGPSLTAALKAMRAACREFVSAGGPDARRYREHYGGPGVDSFSMQLGQLRGLMGHQIGYLLIQYKIEVEDALASMVVWPSPEDDDPTFIPGFE